MPNYQALSIRIFWKRQTLLLLLASILWLPQSVRAITWDTTAVPPTNKLPLTSIRSTRPFTHVSKWFSLAIPQSWVIQDKSNDFASMISADDPSSHATLFVRAQLIELNVTPATMERTLRLNLGLHFLHQPNVKNLVREPAVIQSDGSVRMNFTYDVIDGGKAVSMRGEGYLQLHDQIFVSTVAFGAPANQLDQLHVDFLSLLNSFKVYPEVVDPNQLIIDSMVPYKHPSGVFEINRPGEWHITDESASGSQRVKFFDVVGRAGMMIEISQIPPAKTLDVPALAINIQRYIHQEYAGFQNLSILKPSRLNEQSVSSVFTYDALIHLHKTPMMGLCQMQQMGNKLVVFCIIVPLSTASRLSITLDNLRASLTVHPEIAMQ